MQIRNPMQVNGGNESKEVAIVQCTIKTHTEPGVKKGPDLESYANPHQIPYILCPKGRGGLTVTAAPSAHEGQRGTAVGPSLTCKCRGSRDRWAQIIGVNSPKYK